MKERVLPQKVQWIKNFVTPDIILFVLDLNYYVILFYFLQFTLLLSLDRMNLLSLLS